MTDVRPREVKVRFRITDQGDVLTVCSARFDTGLRQVATRWGPNKVKATDLLKYLLECEAVDMVPRDQGVDPPALSAYLDSIEDNLKS